MTRRKTTLGLLAGGLQVLQVTVAGADPIASDHNHGLDVEVDTLNDVSTLSWWGVSGETYFIQVTPDLTAGWEYIDFIYPGADDVLAHGFAVNTDAFFYRLKYTDQPTSDPWNADFDGDNIGNQDELDQDTDPFAFDDQNANGIPDDWETFWDDQFAVFPNPIEAKLTYGQSATKTLYLNNPVAPDADFTVTVTGNEAAFQGSYMVEDSLTGSAAYDWTEISTTGTELPVVSEADNDSEKIAFDFPLYGRMYSELWVSSNGYLNFGQERNDSGNGSLPDGGFDDALIAIFWDDLDTKESGNDSGTIYYQEFSDRLIVQYEAVTQDVNALTNTFQVVLHADGTIEFFYKELNGVLDTVTVGIHNFDQTQAVQVADNESYLQDPLAVRFTQGPAYLVEVSPLSGTATQSGFVSLAVDFETLELEPGTYQADIEIAHTGTGTTPWNIPAILELTNPPSQIELTAPDDDLTMWGDESVTLRATVTDDDFGIERVEFFADEVKQGEDLYGFNYSYPWQQPTPGVYSVTARAVDRLDTVTISDPITVTVLEDTDLDRMEDAWEYTYFGDLTQEASADFDGDGFPNIVEYHHGTDPTNDPSNDAQDGRPDTPVYSETQNTVSPDSEIGGVRYYRVDGVSDTAYEKSTIQAAISAAGDFDIIEVLPGVYDESINIYDRIYLFSSTGARTTVIDGGARNDSVVYLAAEAVIEGFTIRNGARSWEGGGLYITEGTDFDKMRIAGCVIRDNYAGDQGGGVYVSNGRPTFVSCTIVGNDAPSGGAIYNTSTSNAITLVNTLLWNPDAPDETSGQTSSILWDHSLSRDSATGNVLIDGADQLTADPGLGYDYSLVAASPARDAGTSALHPALDLDGEPLTDGFKDIGADEFNDADADGLPDWVEALGATDPVGDTDGDTLSNLDEYETYLTNPNDADTDSDQLDDGAELIAGTDALDPDTDGDSLPDGWEVNYGLDPLDGATADSDPDGDTLLTSEEFALGTNPTSDDTDGDGLKDNVESAIFASTDTSNFYYLDPTNPDTDGDGINDGLDSADGDELSNLDELALGTNPNLADTDADGVNDSDEVDLGTDPLVNDDFANQDSDNDGLTDLFEINFGTDPNNADTNGNGMNDGEELDSGGDPRVPGDPPDPLNPGDPPGPDPFPPPPPPIYPGSYDIVIESKSIAFPKRGHATFQSTDPAKRYLTLSAQQSFSGGNPESGPKNVSGSKTIEIDPITGESTTTGDSFVNTGGAPESPVRRSGESQLGGYDDPPNEENDEDATINYSSVLSNENTTTMMVTNGKNELEDYEDSFSTWSQTPRAYRNVHENELRFDYQKVQFKFKWDAGVEEDEKFPIRYYVLFIPEDDPDTVENEEETGLEIVDTIEWDGVGDESPVFEIDPDSLKPGEDGRYELVDMGLYVDHNRDGSINTNDRVFAARNNGSQTFYFWINDDDDSGEVGNDDVPLGQNQPGADANNGGPGRVDGLRDLVDFFPLHINLSSVLSRFDDPSLIDIRLSGSALRYIEFPQSYTGFSASQARTYLTDLTTAQELVDFDTQVVSGNSGSPTSLGADFVQLASQGKGVLLMEGHSESTDPLKLHLYYNDQKLFEIECAISLSGVEDMFHHVKLTDVTTEYDGSAITPYVSAPGDRSSAPNWPDARVNDRTFVFLHGYRVNAQEARGWQSEVFKRMHQMGSNARFVGVSWHGATGLDYHKAVFQAFQTGDSLNGALSSYTGDLTVAAHSLGNMVVSHAIQSGSFRPDRYYAINAAVPAEAYVGGGFESDMVEADWDNISADEYASRWYMQFSGSDNRQFLKWAGVFGSVSEDTIVSNFWSGGEDVLDKRIGEKEASLLAYLLNLNFNFTRGAWKTQELVKGQVNALSVPMSRGQGGWGTNGDYPGNGDLAQFPRFKYFRESSLHGADVVSASSTAGNSNVKYDLLARGIPALSYASAVIPLGGDIDSVDMEALGRISQWPSEGHTGTDESNRWLHSDFKNVALQYVYPLYQIMISKGPLNEH